MMQNVIAVDGPSASGKGTMARGLASHFSFVYLDTGLMYRVFGYARTSLSELEKFTVFDYNELLQRLEKVDLRSDEVSRLASTLGSDSAARKEITRLQRDFVRESKTVCILDGRDIGTVVFPDAFCKFFVTADVEIRAKRRFEDLKATGVTFEEVLANLRERDERDKNRKVSPLKLTDDYVVIDTVHPVDECLEKMEKIVAERLNLIRL